MVEVAHFQPRSCSVVRLPGLDRFSTTNTTFPRRTCSQCVVIWHRHPLLITVRQSRNTVSSFSIISFLYLIDTECRSSEKSTRETRKKSFVRHVQCPLPLPLPFSGEYFCVRRGTPSLISGSCSTVEYRPAMNDDREREVYANTTAAIIERDEWKLSNNDDA